MRAPWNAAAAVVACAWLQLAFEAALSLARGSAVDLGYLGLLLSLSTAGAIAIGAATIAAGGGIRAALALWVALDQVARTPPDPATGVAVAAAGFGLAYASLSVLPAGARTPLRCAWIVAPALGSAAGIRPVLAGALGGGGLADAVSGLALGVGLILAGVGVQRLRGRLRPPAPVVAAALLAAMLAIVFAGSQSLRRERRPWGELPPPAATGRPNALLLVLDTVRADLLSIYGAPLDTTPELAAFLARSPRARLYPDTFAPSNWTIPSHVSLLTGRMPSDHGLHYRAFPNLGVSRLASWPFPEGPSLAEAFRQQGYRTVGIVANRHLLRVRGIDRGFDVWTVPKTTRAVPGAGDTLGRWLLPGSFEHVGRFAPAADAVNRDALHFLDGCEQGGCLFLLNYMEAHTPYAPAPPYAGQLTGDPRLRTPRAASIDDSDETIERARLRYAEEIRALDAALGRLLRALHARGVLRRSWVIVTSDHGESFGEHGVVSHCSSVYNEQVRIPLLVHPPDDVQLPDPAGPVDLLDVSRTLAAIAGAPPLGVGRDLRHALDAKPIHMEFYGREPDDPGRHGALAGEPARAVVVGGAKLIAHAGRLELYDLADTREHTDLAARNPERAKALEAQLPVLAPRAAASASPGPLDPEEKEMLRDLGYVR